MTTYRDRIRTAGFAELGAMLTEGPLAFSYRDDLSKLQRGVAVYEADLPTGERLFAEVATSAGKRSRFRVRDGRDGVLAEFVSSPTAGIFGNPSGTGFDEGDVPGNAGFDAFVDALVDAAVANDGDDFTLAPGVNYPGAGGAWIATFESRHTSCRAFGTSPEEALAALDRLWRDRYAPLTGADEDYLAEHRDDIEVNRFDTGCAYILAGGDDLWHRDTVRGSDDRYDALFERDPAPSPR